MSTKEFVLKRLNEVLAKVPEPDRGSISDFWKANGIPEHRSGTGAVCFVPPICIETFLTTVAPSPATLNSPTAQIGRTLQMFNAQRSGMFDYAQTDDVQFRFLVRAVVEMPYRVFSILVAHELGHVCLAARAHSTAQAIGNSIRLPTGMEEAKVREIVNEWGFNHEELDAWACEDRKRITGNDIR